MKDVHKQDDRLTILLTLKGRELHTLRFLYHANLAQLPFSIVIADGQVEERLATLLEQRADLFPNLRYSYVRCPDDETISHYYRKLASSVNNVTTPYVMQTDNDDFVLKTGVQRCLDFLDKSPDFVSCSGEVGGFSTMPAPGKLKNVTGAMEWLVYSYAGGLAKGQAGEKASERVLLCASDGTTIITYYDVFRTPALRQIHTEILDLNPCDLVIQNRYVDGRIVTLGKRNQLPVMAYLRQLHTSLNITNDFGTYDMISRLLAANFVKDLRAYAESLAFHAAKQDGMPDGQPGLAAKILKNVEGHVRSVLGPKPRPSPWRHFVPLWLRPALKRFRAVGAFTSGGMRRVMYRRLRETGADEGYLKDLHHDFVSIDRVLNGPEFEAFLRLHAPHLLTP